MKNDSDNWIMLDAEGFDDEYVNSTGNIWGDLIETGINLVSGAIKKAKEKKKAKKEKRKQFLENIKAQKEEQLAQKAQKELSAQKEQKEKQLRQLEKKESANIMLVGGGVLLLTIIGVVSYKFLKK